MQVWRVTTGRRSVLAMRAITAIASVAWCGCTLHGGNTTPEPARAPARDSLFRIDEARTDSVAVHGFPDGIASLLDTNVVYLRAGAPIALGIDATRAVFSATVEPAGARLSWQPLGGGISDDLRAAYTFGVAVRATAASTPRVGRYIAFWERDRRGPWRIAAYSEVNGPTSSPPTRERAARSGDGDVAPPEAPPTRLSKADAEERAKLRATDSVFSDLSYRMGVAFAFSNTVDAEGIVFGDPQLVIGPDAIEEFLNARAAQSSLVRQPVFAWVSASRDLGFTVGESTSTGRGASGAAVQRMGKYLTVWKRQKDGTWKFMIDGGNSVPPRAEER